MKFEAFNAEDIHEIARFTAGEITFRIENLEEGVTKDGREKTMVHVVMTDVNGQTWKDTLHVTAEMKWRLKQIFEAIGKPELCKKGVLLNDDVKGFSGKGTAKVDSYVGNDGATKNTWKIDKLHPQKAADKPDTSFFDDKVPL